MLHKGDKVGIISPSNFIEHNDIDAGIKYLESFGLKCTIAPNVFKKYRWMAGTPKERANDINKMFKDPSVKAIFCSRGGAGSQKVLPHLDYDIIEQNPKPIFGFSDSTALQLGIYTKTKNPYYSGFLLKGDPAKPMVTKSFKKIIDDKQNTIKSGTTLADGQTEGILIGGCLSPINNLIGTDFFPDLRGKILLLEDIGEKTYQIDMMLEHLKQTKNFDKLSGIIFGKFTKMKISDPNDGTIDDVINYFCQDLKFPIIKNFSYGHGRNRHIIPMGTKATLNANKCELTFK